VTQSSGPEGMSRAEALSKTLCDGGIDAIRELVAARESEQLFFDFKRSRDCGAKLRLHVHDRNNLAKAVSGFGNSEGGVVVRGIDCLRDT